MAKNKNQSRPQHEHADERSNPASDGQGHGKTALAEEHSMPAATRVARKQQKKFGHN